MSNAEPRESIFSDKPVIPVVSIENADSALPLARALLEGGIDVLEITLRTPAAFDALKQVKRSLPEMTLGAGTVLTQDDALRCLDLGVDFGVAPGFNPDTVDAFLEKEIPFVPGVLTPSEIERAMAAGCRLLKFFPAAEAGGPAMLKALAGPYAARGIRFCATGGVNADNLGEYLSLSCVQNVGGSWVAKGSQIAGAEWGAITEQARRSLDAARKAQA